MIERDVGVLTRLRARARSIANGGTGTAAAVLLPRVWSVLTQWLVALVAGTAALTEYLSTTTRGSAAVSLVANALAPVLVLRTGATRSESGRALVFSALSLIAIVAFALTLAFETTLGLGLVRGIYSSAFAAMTVLSAPAIATWPIWQARGRFLPLVGVTVLLLLASVGVAMLRSAGGAAVTIGLASSVPTLAMFGRARLRRAIRYAIAIARRALPVSSMSFATSIVYPLSLQLGTTHFGAEMVGKQLLFWPLVLALGIASQSIAARMLTGARTEVDKAQSLARWSLNALALAIVAAVAFSAFRWRLTPANGASPLPSGMIIAAAAFIFSDPICVFFCPPNTWRLVAIGSVLSAIAVGAAVFMWPVFMIDHFSVCGPSAIVAALRLVFVRHPPLRGRARLVFAMLAAGFVISVWLR